MLRHKVTSSTTADAGLYKEKCRGSLRDPLAFTNTSDDLAELNPVAAAYHLPAAGSVREFDGMVGIPASSACLTVAQPQWTVRPDQNLLRGEVSN